MRRTICLVCDRTATNETRTCKQTCVWLGLLGFIRSLETTFAALLTQLGPENIGEEGKPMPMKLEAWPGGRWFRDLGDNNGHFWGHVQAIKQPTLLEICGPLFMSYAVVSNMQYRLTSVNGGTLITFKHSVLGYIPGEVREHMLEGWTTWHERVRERAESGK